MAQVCMGRKGGGTGAGTLKNLGFRSACGIEASRQSSEGGGRADGESEVTSWRLRWHRNERGHGADIEKRMTR